MLANKITAAAAAAATIFSFSASAAEQLRLVSFIPKNHPVLVMANDWVDTVNAELGDQVQINFVGGPEVMNRFQQVEAMSSGVIDIVVGPTADYTDRLPSANAFVLSLLTPMEERESGFYDYMYEKHRESLNAVYLGRVHRSPFYLWTKTKPESLADLAGLKMRTGSLYDQMMRELGMIPVTMNSPEVYTGLQSGIIDGFGWPAVGPRNLGWLEEVKNVVDIPFFNASNLAILVNAEAFDALPEETQTALKTLTAEWENKMVAHYAEEEQQEWAAIGDMVEKVTFSEEENARYASIGYDVEWARLAESLPEDEVARLREMTGN